MNPFYLLAGAVAMFVAATIPPAYASPADSNPLKDVKSWGYQLQDLNVERAKASPFDLLVIDGESNSAKTVKALKERPRKVAAYISVGEAEDYRPYWNPKAPFVGKLNPHWKGNYFARFWVPEWQQIVFKMIDDIAAKGFDGLYLDRVDVWEDMLRERKSAEQDMVNFLEAISKHARSKGLFVILQNAASLTRFPRAMDAIDAIAREDLWYGAERDGVANSKEESAEGVHYLKQAYDAGKPIFVVEYVTGQRIPEVTRRNASFGFITYIGNRPLSRLIY